MKKKELSFTLKEEKDIKGKGKKESSNIAKATINLADYSDHGTIKIETLQMSMAKERKSKEKRNPTLMIKIETQWLKLNNKVLVKKSEINDKSEDKQSDGPTVTIGNDEFVLQQAEDPTDTSMGGVSDNEEEDKGVFESDDEEKKRGIKKRRIKKRRIKKRRIKKSC